MWGLGLPKDVTLTKVESWGARALLERGFVDLLYDRQGWETRPVYENTSWEPSKAFCDWLSKRGMPALRKWAKDVPADSDRVYAMREGNYALFASPNRSYGYLYITAIWAQIPEEAEALWAYINNWQQARNK